MLGDVRRIALDQPLRAAQPPGRAPHLAMEHQLHADPEPDPRGGQRLAGLEVEVMRALEDAKPYSGSRPSM